MTSWRNISKELDVAGDGDEKVFGDVEQRWGLERELRDKRKEGEGGYLVFI